LEQTAFPLPSPTAFLYTVVSGDTLTSIANRYGITVKTLQAVNPAILPQTLVVGTQLIIPSEADKISAIIPTPEPVPVKQARCWQETSGGIWCFALLQNEYQDLLENISVQVTLQDNNGNKLASEIAYAPLNILPGGARMPVGVHFPVSTKIALIPVFQVITAIRMIPGDSRYLPVMLDNVLITINDSGRSAQVSGRVALTIEDGTANTVWVLGIAYDKTGQLVGFRRWDSMISLSGGEGLVFDMLISSMGPKIERVEFLTEARP
jgi:murein DD-endopeptidase MepM/ murein hydrolase activator NlpD